MSTATSARGYKRPWLRSFNCMRSNNALQLTSGGFMAGASRPPSSMRRSQLNAVLYATCGKYGASAVKRAKEGYDA
jgi:hypothetical protein